MQQYRTYCLNDEGRFVKAEEIEAASDREAMAYANEHHSNCEVWSGARLVGTVPAHSDA